jgi:hypothetical protein
MKAVYGLYSEGNSAQRAVDRLRAQGFADREITVLTSEPREDMEFGHMGAKNRLWHVACLGGVIGLTLATALLYYAEHAWPIVVGGLPIFAWWPNLIIMFELTFLGAILATVITLVATALWADRKAELYDPEISDGLILVGIENPRADVVDSLQQTLATGADARIKSV